MYIVKARLYSKRLEECDVCDAGGCNLTKPISGFCGDYVLGSTYMYSSDGNMDSVITDYLPEFRS